MIPRRQIIGIHARSNQQHLIRLPARAIHDPGILRVLRAPSRGGSSGFPGGADSSGAARPPALFSLRCQGVHRQDCVHRGGRVSACVISARLPSLLRPVHLSHLHPSNCTHPTAPPTRAAACWRSCGFVPRAWGCRSRQAHPPASPRGPPRAHTERNSATGA